ncbi:hypothetical protein ACIGW4_33700 [Streptomyces sp. NPDC053513]|uniref:hypothetical protein n=1 Tax=unclassified Streptomyces TaxID=2593676 RepID=UPI0037D0E4FE
MGVPPGGGEHAVLGGEAAGRAAGAHPEVRLGAGVRLLDPVGLTDPALYALLVIGGGAFLLYTSALQRGSVTTATAGLVLGETIGPAIVGVAWLGDRTRPGLTWLALLGFAVAIAGSLTLARFGEAPATAPEESPAPGPDTAAGPGRR